MQEFYYPALINPNGSVRKIVGTPMSHTDAIAYIKQHYSGAWEHALAAPVKVGAPEVVSALLANYDLTTYKGWVGAASVLLAGLPPTYALRDLEYGFIVLKEGALLAVPANEDGSTEFELEDGMPVDSVQVDYSAWNEATQAFEGSDPVLMRKTLQEPEYVNLTFISS